MSQSTKEQFLAEMIVRSECSFAHLGLTLQDIGVPPLTADKKTCSGHSWKDFCTACRFNYCQECGDAIPNSNRVRRAAACWTGLCGNHDQATNTEHHERVMQLVKQMMGEEATETLHKDESPAGSGWAGDRMIGSRIPRIQIAKAPKARIQARSMPVASIASAAVVAPQINISIAPLAQMQVETTDTMVRRIADGAMGNARFEVTVSVVLEQVVGQQI
jgi:hypothetical protein